MSNYLSLIEVDVSQLVDTILQDIVQWININEIDLPDVRDIIKPPAIEHFHLLNGYATNLKDISSGEYGKPSYSKIMYQNRSLVIQTAICFNKLQFAYDYDANLRGYALSGKIIGAMHNLKIHLRISIKNLLITVELVDVLIHHIDLDIKANDRFGWITSLILRWIVKPKIRKIVQQKVSEFIQKLALKVNSETFEYRSKILRTGFVRDWVVQKLTNLNDL